MRILFALFILIAAPSVQAEESSSLKFENAYSFATSASQKHGVVLGTITNSSDEDVRIVAADADVSETVELHTHMMDGDIMQMREVDGYDVPAGGELVLKAAGDHIMLMNLKAPLEQEQSFIAAITTKDGQEISFPVVIRAPGDVPEDAEEGGCEHCKEDADDNEDDHETYDHSEDEHHH